MSLATFKKKSIHITTKQSGKQTSDYWVYQGPYGKRTNLSSTIYLSSLHGIQNGYYSGTNAGFSINGVHRNVGSVGSHMGFSKSATPYRGVHPKGWGGKNGQYPVGQKYVVSNIGHVMTGVGVQNATVKPPVLETKGMLERRFKWIHSGQYPNYWVQPVSTGNMVENSSQGFYTQNKSTANNTVYDVNDRSKYEGYYVNRGSSNCRSTPAGGYTMTSLQRNAPYTKTLYRPRDSSEHTSFIQRRCKNPVGFQKPFPYAVQTGTGILGGGINVSNVGSACNTSGAQIVPPDWYTGASILKSDGSKTTLRDQLELQRRNNC